MFVCVTVIILVGIYVRSPEKFRGISLGYKEFKVETPKLSEQPAEVISNPSGSVEPKSLEVRRPPFLALFDAVEKQDRAGIEVAIDEMRDDPPFGFSPQELEAYKFSELLNAGFADAIDNLKTIEENQPNQVQASLALARYYFRMRADSEAEKHLKIADDRSHTDERKVDVAMLRAEIARTTKGREAAAEFLEAQIERIEDNKQRFRILNELGDLSSANGNRSKAIIAFERALSCEPENVDTRFKLALIYSAIAPLKMLGLRHYRIINQQNHMHTGALHNRGLLYGEFGLPGLKVELIKKAAEQKDSHAMGSLAHFYVESGFLDDAEKIIVEAPTDLKLADRIIAAQQYLRKTQQENEARRETLVQSSEDLSGLTLNYPFAEKFKAENYLGLWVDTKGERTSLHIESSSVGVFPQFKFTMQTGDRKVFAYTNSFSPIAQIDFSTVDKQPLGLLWAADGEIKVAILFGEETLRVIEPDGIRIKSSRDYKRE